jgi:hypothetical protein
MPLCVIIDGDGPDDDPTVHHVRNPRRPLILFVWGHWRHDVVAMLALLAVVLRGRLRRATPGTSPTRW